MRISLSWPLMGLLLSPFFAAQACDQTFAPACSVRTSPDEVIATFPILKPSIVWEWNRNSTEDNGLEYKWEATFGSCSSSGKFEPSSFAFGVQHFKFPGSKTRSGLLQVLLDDSQNTFVRRQDSQGNKSSYSMVTDPAISVKATPNSVQITVVGSKYATELAPYALLTVWSPVPGQAYNCIVKVLPNPSFNGTPIGAR